VREPEHLIALRPARGELVLISALLIVDEIALAHDEQLRCLLQRLTPPLLERAHVEDVGGHTLVVEVENLFVAGEDVTPPFALLELLESLSQLAIAAPEGTHALVDPAWIPLTLHERVTDEQLACSCAVDAGEL